jgi:hypothetical protein
MYLENDGTGVRVIKAYNALSSPFAEKIKTMKNTRKNLFDEITKLLKDNNKNLQDKIKEIPEGSKIFDETSQEQKNLLDMDSEVLGKVESERKKLQPTNQFLVFTDESNRSQNIRLSMTHNLPLWSKSPTKTTILSSMLAKSKCICWSNEMRPMDPQVSKVNVTRRRNNLYISIENHVKKLEAMRAEGTMEVPKVDEQGNTLPTPQEVLEATILSSKANWIHLQDILKTKYSDVSMSEEMQKKMKVLDRAKANEVFLPKNKVTDKYVSDIYSKRANKEHNKKTATKKNGGGSAEASKIEEELKAHGLTFSKPRVKKAGQKKGGQKKGKGKSNNKKGNKNQGKK